MSFILADGGLSFGTVFDAFSSAFSSCLTFFTANPIFYALIGVPVGAYVVGTVVKSIR